MMRSLFNMTGRSPDQHHRASTPLELFFDLVFVVAIASAAAQLHHGFIANHALEASVSFIMVFFAIWWAWMGFTWFASAFDVDDAPYRILVFVQMFGSLVIASGVPDVFEEHSLTRITIGYSIMRLGLVGLWLRTYYSQPVNSHLRTNAMRNVIGIVVCQIGWLGLLVLPSTPIWVFFIMVALELAAPVWAQSSGRTPWHPEHIAERYSLLTLIVLGESVLSLSLALQATNSFSDISLQRGLFMLAGFSILFCLWWLYFNEPVHDLLKENKNIAFAWGYGHYVIFSSAAAVGAALAATVDILDGKATLNDTVLGLILTIPLAFYLLGLWYCHEQHRMQTPRQKMAYPIAAILLLLSSVLPQTMLWCTVILIGLLIWRVRLNKKVNVTVTHSA